MIFNFWIGNHILMGQRSLEDVIGILGKQLRALGHHAMWDRSNKVFLSARVAPNAVTFDGQTIPGGPAYNVLVEGFNAGIAAMIGEYHARGARFLVLATEEPTDRGFNHGTQREMVLRQRDFHLIAPYVDGILALVPGRHVLDWYSQHAPTAYVELGYAPSLVRRDPWANGEPPYDFGFYGSISRRRLGLLKRIKVLAGPRSRGIRVVGDFVTQEDRDRAMQDCKVIVQIRKFEEMGLVSSSRCNTALCLGRPVVAEPHDLSKPWDEVVTFARDDADFFEQLVLARANWRGLHARQFETFRRRLDPAYCVGRALDELGLADARRAA